jgi:hypothetical protein
MLCMFLRNDYLSFNNLYLTSTRCLILIKNYYFSIFWCSQSGDDSEENLVKFGYKTDIYESKNI